MAAVSFFLSAQFLVPIIRLMTVVLPQSTSFYRVARFPLLSPKMRYISFEPPNMRFVTKYVQGYHNFLGTACYWIEAFAITSSLGIEEKVQKLLEMSFPEVLARNTLEAVGGDENFALEKLCSS